MRKIIVIIGLILLLISACKPLFQKPEILMVQDLQLIKFSPDKSEVRLALVIHNPNKYDIRLKSLRLELLDKKRLRVGEAELDKNHLLPGKKSSTLELNVDILTRPLLQNLSSISQETLFYISAVGEAKALGINKKFSFDEPYSVNLKEHIEQALGSFGGGGAGQDIFKLTRTYVDEIGLKKSVLNADFILINPYGLSFVFKDFPAKIYIDGKEVGQGQLKQQMKFDPDLFHQEGTLTFELSNLKSLWGAGKGALRGEISYRVKGNIIVEALGLRIKNPYEFDGKIPVSVWDLLMK